MFFNILFSNFLASSTFLVGSVILKYDKRAFFSLIFKLLFPKIMIKSIKKIHGGDIFN